MNQHLPRSPNAEVELAHLAEVSTQIISPQNSNPVIGPVQDNMLACYRWTDQGPERGYLDARKVMRLASWTSTYDGMLPEATGGKLGDGSTGWMARDIYSSFLPKFTMIKGKPNDDGEHWLKIVHGKFVDGVLSKSTAGGKLSKIIHRIWKDYGPDSCRLFLDNLMNVHMQWLLMDGFSIGLADCVIEEKVKEDIKGIVKKVYKDAEKTIAKLRSGKLEVKFSFMSIVEQFEMDMLKILDTARNEAQSKAHKSLKKYNRFNAAVVSGSKGKPENIVQITSLIGQQVVEGGKRIESGYKDRTLPHFSKFDVSPEAHGFVESNFLNGLNPAEYFLHAISGREGVISTAIKTGITGYQQRKLVKVMEDLRVHYDGTVRNANNFIVSHRYGMDGFDGSQLEHEKFDYFGLGRTGFVKKYQWTDAELKENLTDKVYREIVGGRDFGVEFLQQEVEQLWGDRTVLREVLYKGITEMESVFSPVNFKDLLTWIGHECGILEKDGERISDKKADLNPADIIRKVNALIRDIQTFSGWGGYNETDEYGMERRGAIHSQFIFLVRNYLNSKRLIVDHRFNQVALDMTLLKVKESFMKAIINPGDMIGIIAAQSIGEPLTQLTLDTFHSTGLGKIKTNRITSVPRLREIFSATTSTSMKTPGLTIWLDHQKMGIDSGTDEAEATRRSEMMLDQVKFTVLEQLLERENGMQIYVDPDEESTLVEADRKWLAEVREFEEWAGTTPWLIRLRFDSRKIQNITLEDIRVKLKAKLPREVLQDVVYNDINDPKEVVMRIRVNIKGDEPKKELRDVGKKILLTQVKGLTSILGGSANIVDRDVVTKDGEILSKGSKGWQAMRYTDGAKKEKINPMTRQFIIMTEGTNLHDALALPATVTYKTLTNDIHEMLNVLGIEATRELIIQEISEAINNAVSRRHLSTLADVMTAQGILVSVDRYGVSKTDTGVLSRATFEETTKKISEASLYGETDQMEGVSGNMMFGQFFKGGTNAFDVLLDEEVLLDPDTRLYSQEDKRREIRRVEVESNLVDGGGIDLDFNFEL